MRLLTTLSGIGKGVIGTSPQAPAEPPSPSVKSSLPQPRSAHEPLSTIHSFISLSPKPSQRPSRAPSIRTNRPTLHIDHLGTSSTLSLPSLVLDTPGNESTVPSSPLATPDTLYTIVTSLLESTGNPELNTPSSIWSFLNDSNYVHPLLAKPLPASCHSIASSTGLLLKTAGLKVTAIKIDPYMNIDAGTMAPTEHGEVYVLNDGGETDLDLGNYERYLNVSLGKDNNVTTGKVYQHVIDREVSQSSERWNRTDGIAKR